MNPLCISFFKKLYRVKVLVAVLFYKQYLMFLKILQYLVYINELFSVADINQAVASTPYINKNNKQTSPEPSENQSETSPWITQLSQILNPTANLEKQKNTNFPSNIIYSPAHSMDSTFTQRKKQKIFDDNIVTPSKAPLIVNRTKSTQKKKFIPGF